MNFLLQIYMFILGTIFGSFFNVCIYRIPQNKSIINPPSKCTTCNTRLKPIDLIPILSYIISNRKCRYCKKEISPRYVLVEFLTGILFVLVYNAHLISIKIIYYLLLIFYTSNNNIHRHRLLYNTRQYNNIWYINFFSTKLYWDRHTFKGKSYRFYILWRNNVNTNLHNKIYS